jgi:6-pyruvoyltetrahydropterin/6-carboxytetrahydropterin synthase
MYGLGVLREFDAHHYLTGGDWGEENKVHSHHYRAEVMLSGKALDRHGYLTDITDIERALDELVERYKGSLLNDLPEFAGLNPSIEHLCRIWCRTILEKIESGHLASVCVRIWENEFAWATYTEQLR